MLNCKHNAMKMYGVVDSIDLDTIQRLVLVSRFGRLVLGKMSPLAAEKNASCSGEKNNVKL
jgi:hypothetical protein